MRERSTAKPLISVIVPVINEDRTLRSCLEALGESTVPHEVIISDAGSDDGSLQIAREAGAKIVTCSKKGRSWQMNAGALEATGEVFLFLHADTRLSRGALEELAEATREGGLSGGAFSRRYESGGFVLNLTCLTADWRCRLLGWFLGDQAIFATRRAFEAVGGFPPYKTFEDLDFSRRLKSVGTVRMLRSRVCSSPRRFARRGPVLQTLIDVGLTVRYLLRTIPELSEHPASAGETNEPCGAPVPRPNSAAEF